MKRFKNPLIVEGPQSLLKAFYEELDKLGYKRSHVHTPSKGIVTLGDESSNSSYFVTKGSALDYTTVNAGPKRRLIFQLPQDWNQALKAASELEEEKPKFKVGDYFKQIVYTDETKTIIEVNLIYKICAIDSKSQNYVRYITDDPNTVLINIENNAPIADFVRLTPEEIESHLIKEAEKKGFNKLCTFIGVRDNKAEEAYKGVMWNKSAGKIGSEWIYKPDTDVLLSSGFGLFVVYEKGVWATLKPSDPEITLAGYKGEFTADGVKFGCAFIHRKDLEAYCHIYKSFSLDTNVKIEGIKISKDGHSDILTIDQIKQIAEHFNKN